LSFYKDVGPLGHIIITYNDVNELLKLCAYRSKSGAWAFVGRQKTTPSEPEKV
jgi:hypothetical protein